MMDIYTLQQMIIDKFLKLPGADSLLSETIRIVVDPVPERTLMPEGDVPSNANRPEYRVTAFLKDVCGEAYTEYPESFEGTMQEVLKLPVSEEGISAGTLAALNAAMNYLGLCPGTFPDNPASHFNYADRLCDYMTEQFGRSNIVLIGYDGYIVKRFMDEEIDFWTLDRNPDNITKDRFNHVIVNSGKYNREACFSWGKILLITGSSFCNGTVIQYLDKEVPVLFYGITCAGAAKLLELPWFPI